jgi:hypothetical protein
VPINRELQDPQTAQTHIQGHSAYMDSEEFTKLDDLVKKLYIDHVKAEIAFIKEQKGGGEQPMAEQPMEQPMAEQPMEQPVVEQSMEVPQEAPVGEEIPIEAPIQ